MPGKRLSRNADVNARDKVDASGRDREIAKWEMCSN